MRTFQPLNQQAYGRILVETRTNVHLSPGLISLEKPSEIEGFSGYFDFLIPPPFDDKSERELFWNLPEEKKDKALTKSHILKFEPFYPPFISEEISSEDFTSYVEKFLSLETINEQIFTLPLQFGKSDLLDEILKTDCSIIRLVGLQALFNNQKLLAENLNFLRNKLSPDIALYLPGVVSPVFLPFLVYAGIDFFDNTIAYFTEQKGYFLTFEGVYPLENHPSCHCSYCKQETPNLKAHNELTLKSILSHLRYTLENGNLRNLIEKHIHDSVTLAATLRHLDKKFSENLQVRTPILANSPIRCIGDESLNRPIIKEFRERIKERYVPKEAAKIIVLLPCSARKPYSFSKSHMFFRKAIREGSKNFSNLVSELIITSPLSVVPRELEAINPVRFYDIPVSGQWSSEEIKITTSLLLSLLSKYDRDTIIINHTHGKGYEEIVNNIRSKTSFKILDSAKKDPPTRNTSLSELRKALENSFKEINPEIKHYPSSILEQIRATSDFQYGIGTGKKLFPQPVKIKGKYPQNRQIFSEGMLIATLLTSNGFLSLQPQIASKIAGISYNKLEFGTDKVSGSTIFAPGCIKADERIHPNDEIFIMNENNILATATALVAGQDINKMTSGKVAIVKKKLKVNK